MEPAAATSILPGGPGGPWDNIWDVLEWCVNTISGNAILFTLFIASVVFVGFKIFKRAKKAARS